MVKVLRARVELRCALPGPQLIEIPLPSADWGFATPAGLVLDSFFAAATSSGAGGPTNAKSTAAGA